MKVSRQGFYRHESREDIKQEEDERILSAVRRIRAVLETVGVRKLQVMLKTLPEFSGCQIGRDRLFDLLRKHGLLSKLHDRYCVTSVSSELRKFWPNMLKDIQITRPNQVWVSDITYVLVGSEFYFLSLVTDAYSRKILGYNLSRRMFAEDVLKAFQYAWTKYQPGPGLIHHSDKGSQYASALYTGWLAGRGVQISMTGPGRCFDNPIAERVNGILKDEFGLRRLLKDYKTALKLVRDSIKLYNGLRLHKSLNYKTPDSVYHRPESRDAA